MTLRIAIPNKGRLMEETIDTLRSIGLRVPHNIDRTLMATVNEGKYQVLFTRADDIPEYVSIGAADVGITGLDLVAETGVHVTKLLDLDYGRCRLVVAAPESAHAGDLSDLPKNARVATSLPGLTRRYFERKKMKVEIVPISGAAELTPYIGVADAIVDLVQTGATLKQNHLQLLDVVLDSWAVLIGPKHPTAAHKQATEDIVEAIRSVQAAHARRYLMANVPKKSVEAVRKIIPGLSSPTIMETANAALVAMHAVVAEDHLNELIPKLKKAGASGILVLPIERLIP